MSSISSILKALRKDKKLDNEIIQESEKNSIKKTNETIEEKCHQNKANKKKPYIYEVPNEFKNKLYIGAPMVKASDVAFRVLCCKYGTDIAFSPMYYADLLVTSREYQEWALETSSKCSPYVVQLGGTSNKEILLEAVKICEANGVAAVDLNYGCPLREAKHLRFGSYMLDCSLDRNLIIENIAYLTSHVNIPIFCKIRILPNHSQTIEFVHRIEAAGCALLTIHARQRGTTRNRHNGPLYLNIVRDIMTDILERHGERDNTTNRHPTDKGEQYPSDEQEFGETSESVKKLVELDKYTTIPNENPAPVSNPDRMLLVVNGAISCLKDAVYNLQYTGCDGVMSAEALLGNPCLFKDRGPINWSNIMTEEDISTSRGSNGGVSTSSVGTSSVSTSSVSTSSVSTSNTISVANNDTNNTTISNITTLTFPRPRKPHPLLNMSSNINSHITSTDTSTSTSDLSVPYSSLKPESDDEFDYCYSDDEVDEWYVNKVKPYLLRRRQYLKQQTALTSNISEDLTTDYLNGKCKEKYNNTEKLETVQVSQLNSIVGDEIDVNLGGSSATHGAIVHYQRQMLECSSHRNRSSIYHTVIDHTVDQPSILPNTNDDKTERSQINISQSINNDDEDSNINNVSNINNMKDVKDLTNIKDVKDEFTNEYAKEITNIHKHRGDPHCSPTSPLTTPLTPIPTSTSTTSITPTDSDYQDYPLNDPMSNSTIPHSTPHSPSVLSTLPPVSINHQSPSSSTAPHSASTSTTPQSSSVSTHSSTVLSSTHSFTHSFASSSANRHFHSPYPPFDPHKTYYRREAGIHIAWEYYNLAQEYNINVFNVRNHVQRMCRKLLFKYQLLGDLAEVKTMKEIEQILFLLEIRMKNPNFKFDKKMQQEFYDNQDYIQRKRKLKECDRIKKQKKIARNKS